MATYSSKKYPSGSITSAQLEDGSVVAVDIANNAITTDKILDSAVTVGKLASTLDLSGKTVTLPAGVGGHASGTEANRPASPDIGTIYFNTDEDVLQQYTSSGWIDVGAVTLSITTVTGTIYNTVETVLTITGSGFGLSATVRFGYGGTNSDVLVTPDSDNQITVTVPSAVYGQSAGTSISISVIVSGRVSNGANKTVIAPPTGGTITTSGSYRIHTFTSSSNFVVPSGVSLTNVEYLVLAGGGGGGWQHGGGGGAGGYRSSVVGENSGGGAAAEETLTLSSGTYGVTIGLGGAGTNSDVSGQYTGTKGGTGGNSIFHTITSLGGGGGGSYRANIDSAANGASGGSGGGGGALESGNTGCGYGQLGGAGTTGQGYAGGRSSYAGAGGGGAGGVGEVGCGSNPFGDAGDGGIGVTSSITGTPVARGGGGGGGSYGSNQSGGSAGVGVAGGGNGGWSTAGFNGTQYLGGGGGGGGVYGQFGGNGGDGVVIVRYQL